MAMDKLELLMQSRGAWQLLLTRADGEKHMVRFAPSECEVAISKLCDWTNQGLVPEKTAKRIAQQLRQSVKQKAIGVIEDIDHKGTVEFKKPKPLWLEALGHVMSPRAVFLSALDGLLALCTVTGAVVLIESIRVSVTHLLTRT